jgi:predicted regulator of Ras-like GTPase activity (Roadblock/LC7/MglB family)
VDPAEALADLMEISSQVEASVLLHATEGVLASTVAPEREERLARAAQELLAAADEVAGHNGPLTHLAATTRSGGVFVVRDGERAIAAATAPSPTIGLVFYDLRVCLRETAAGNEQRDAPA